ncbi:MAG: aminopeptidase P family N-terminal domain-containing protein, partial [Erysipelotrichaceae bacterium]|nr:aminopeptidase P family N-terminal domain-containing protein [Erysipelotrichaceae bacterium]
MNRYERVLEKMREHDLSQLIVCDPYSINYLTGCWNEPFERMWVLLLKDSGEQLLFANLLFNVSKARVPVILYSDTDDYVGMLAQHIDSSRTLGVDKLFAARFLIPLMNSTGVRTVLGSQCVDDVRAVKDEEEQKLMIEASAINDKVMEEVS